jgi:hypothetical protein
MSASRLLLFQKLESVFNFVAAVFIHDASYCTAISQNGEGTNKGRYKSSH